MNDTTERLIVPIALRAAAKFAKEPHKSELEDAAKQCEAASNLSSAKKASLSGRLASRWASAYADARDKVLTAMADIGLQVLIDMKSPGCEWLDLTEEK